MNKSQSTFHYVTLRFLKRCCEAQISAFLAVAIFAGLTQLLANLETRKYMKRG